MKRIVMFLLAMLLLATSASADPYIAGDGMGSARGIQGTGIVISRNISLRQGPSFDDKVITSIENGTELRIDGEQGNWLRVRATTKKGTFEGWVIGDYVVVEPMKIVLREGNVPAYAAPSQLSKKVGSLNAFTELHVIGVWDHYYVVSLREASAFVERSVLHWTDQDLAQYDQSAGFGFSLRVKRDTVLRTGPSEHWARGETIKAGKQLETVNQFEYDGFYIVRNADGMIAYVKIADVEIVR